MLTRPSGATGRANMLFMLLLAAAAADALTFLHIPETAGSTIETLSMDWKKKRCGKNENGVVWRRACDWHTPPLEIFIQGSGCILLRRRSAWFGTHLIGYSRSTSSRIAVQSSCRRRRRGGGSGIMRIISRAAAARTRIVRAVPEPLPLPPAELVATCVEITRFYAIADLVSEI